MAFRSHAVPLSLAVVISIIAVWSGINPSDRLVWYAEVLPIVLVFGLLILTYPKFQFSSLAYFLMSLWLILHLIGAKYTFADVPFEWANRFLAPLLGESRNHFDRIAHYLVGFYSFPAVEWLLRKGKCDVSVACLFALFFIMAVAAGYEIIEWQFAVMAGGSAGVEFLGSQGDVWDAQKDMLADTLGALTALIIYLIARPDLSLKKVRYA